MDLSEPMKKVEKSKTVYVEDPEKHIGLVWHIVQSKFNIPNPAVEFAEEFSDGMLGLVNACRKFDPTLGLKFSTYAYKCIIHAILTGRRKQNRFNERYSTGSQIHIEGKEDYREDLKVEIDYQSCSEWLTSHQEFLSPRLQHVISLRRQGATLNEIGISMSISKERVRQLQDEAVQLLQYRILNKSQPECIGA